jgi:hypothetical protein
MADAFGALALPAPVASAGAAVGDPLLDTLLAYLKAAINADGGAAWAAVAPGTPAPVATVRAHNPRLWFNTRDLPALFLWRGGAPRRAREAQGIDTAESTLTLAWVPSLASPEHTIRRWSFRNVVEKAVHRALARQRHPAWVVEGDTYYDAATLGSVLARHTKHTRLAVTGGPEDVDIVVPSGENETEAFPAVQWTLTVAEAYEPDLAAYAELDAVEATLTTGGDEPLTTGTGTFTGGDE